MTTRALQPPEPDGLDISATWRPRTRNALAELPDLIDAASTQMGGPVTRASLNIDEWDLPHPRRLSLHGRVVRLGWFHHIDPHTVTVGRGTFDRVSLTVAPADPS